MLLRVLIFLTAFDVPYQIYAHSFQNDRVLFEKVFDEWTQAFNQKNLTQTCNLFAKSIIANYQGSPQKNYASICNGFKKIFANNDLKYHYTFKLYSVYLSGDIAAVRITWYLYKEKKMKKTLVTQDEGLDVLRKNKQGQWQILNYLAYPVLQPSASHR